MSTLRSNLQISSGKEMLDGCVITDPDSGSTYRFNHTESMILDAIKKPYHKAVLVAKINSKHDIGLQISELDQFIEKLSALGLLGEGDNKTTSTTSDISENLNIIEKHDGENQSGQEIVKKTHNQHWKLFCPQGLLDFIVLIFGFSRPFYYLYLIGLLFATVAFVLKIELFSADAKRAFLNFGLLTHMVFTMFTTNFLTQVFKGIAARKCEIETPSFGIALAYGLIPRFSIALDMNESIPKDHKLRIISASFKARAMLFLVGVIFWVTSRHQGTMLSDFWVVLVTVAILSFLFMANPLFGSDGSRYLAVYFDEPKLREKAFLALRHTFFKQPESVGRYVSNSRALKLFALLSLLFLIAVILFVSVSMASWLKVNYNGLGVSVFILLVAYLLWQANVRSAKRKMKQAGIDTSARVQRTKSDYLGSFSSVRWLRCIIFSIFVVSLFLPYRYETGGAATIFPIRSQQIYVEMPGIVENIFVESNTWIQKGVVVAELSNHKQLRDVEVTKQAIIKTTEDLNVLLTTPSKEELKLAKEQLSIAQLEYTYSIANTERMEELYKKGSVSLVTYLDSKEKSEVDFKQSLEKEANLRVVENLVNDHAIKSAKADLMILEKDLVFYEEQLRRTRLTMPSDGRIITMNLDNMVNKYFEDGQLFAEIEKTDKVQVEISIPEPDIGQVSLGSHVSLKVIFLPNEVVSGKVSDIYPSTTETEYGNVIKIISIIPNDGGVLQTGMTGYAKVQGEEMYLAEAFTRALTRFVLVEAWSWLP